MNKQEILENLDDVKKYINEIEEDKIKEKTEKKFEIKNRFTGNVIYTSSKTTYKEVLEEAVASEADLCGADLREANLHEADLHEADLREADLCGADLREANLHEADLHEANLFGADLRGADLMSCKFYGKGGISKIKKTQLPDFMKALGFIIED